MVVPDAVQVGVFCFGMTWCLCFLCCKDTDLFWIGNAVSDFLRKRFLGLCVISHIHYKTQTTMAFLTAAAIATLAAAAINGGISAYANGQSQQAMERYRNALSADRARAAQKEDYLENVDPLHTKSGSALSTDMAEKLNDVNTAAAGRNAVMGGGGHNAAATKDVTSQLMGAYQRSLIRQHEMNIVPQLQYYRSQYDRANSALEKAEYDKSVANIQAASQAAQGMVNAVAAAGSQMGTPSADGNGTKTGAVTELPKVASTPPVGDPYAAEQYRFNPREALTYPWEQ